MIKTKNSLPANQYGSFYLQMLSYLLNMIKYSWQATDQWMFAQTFISVQSASLYPLSKLFLNYFDYKTWISYCFFIYLESIDLTFLFSFLMFRISFNLKDCLELYFSSTISIEVWIMHFLFLPWYL